MKFKYKFKNAELYKTALTHSSYANENRRMGLQSNERLEFLGDSILGFLSAEYLFATYAEIGEGELTKLRAAIVCEKSLYKLAKEMELGEAMYLGHGEEVGGGRDRSSVLSDCVEALLAAIYLDSGMEEAKAFILPFIKREARIHARVERSSDHKTTLQEIVQKNKEEVLTYQVVLEDGPAHEKYFEVEVLINSNIIARGKGKSKRMAEQDAARLALQLMGQ